MNWLHRLARFMFVCIHTPTWSLWNETLRQLGLLPLLRAYICVEVLVRAKAWHEASVPFVFCKCNYARTGLFWRYYSLDYSCRQYYYICYSFIIICCCDSIRQHTYTDSCQWKHNVYIHLIMYIEFLSFTILNFLCEEFITRYMTAEPKVTYHNHLVSES